MMRKKRTLTLFFLFTVSYATGQDQTGEKLFINTLNDFLDLSQPCLETLESLVSSCISSPVRIYSDSNPLFEHYPSLAHHIPYKKLGSFPTPIKNLKLISKQYNAPIYIKQDSLSGKKCSDGTRLFGGNKVRKLEFLLADACAQGAKSVLTFGCVGSNHAVATACYAKLLGLQPLVMLKHQPLSHTVRRNLLLMQHYGAELHLSPNSESRSIQTVSTCIGHKQNKGDFPYIIPTGGSVPVGILGFVNAAFELKQQIKEALMPEPDYIYVAAGSLGTTVGLMLGIKATGLKTRVIPVSVEPVADESLLKKKIISLFEQTNKLLTNADPSFPRLTVIENEINVIENFSGDNYGLFTQEGQDTIKLLLQKENIKLDGTYTAKAFAALLHDIETKKLKNSVVLFWNTFCQNSFDKKISFQDYSMLPICFHTYFEDDVQVLDF